MHAPKISRGGVVERDQPGGIGGIDRYRQGLQQLVGILPVPVEAIAVQPGVAQMLHGFLAEDVDRPDDAAGVVLDRLDIDKRHDAFTAGSLDDDFLIAQSLPGCKHLAHGTFRRGDQITLQAVKAI